jgi:hypothetical protein
MSQSQTVATPTLEDFKGLKAQASRKAAWSRDGVSKPERFLVEVSSLELLRKALHLLEELNVGLVGGAALNLAVDFESKVDAKILQMSIAQMQTQAQASVPSVVKKKSLILPPGKALDNAWIPYIEDCDGVTEVTPSPIGLKVAFTSDCDWDDVLTIWNRLIG